ncbi:TraM-like conjugate transposon protein [Bacteroides eggerthii]|uniref:TraM-like conjugate transposon protein n=1 Tax=Bacteroides eggerthii TaxID=28111 RepID=A0A380ZK34_9BACE|nr:conjugative transposon protein TraM [Bacteroides eggerthii]SUV47267.1 TraM-like conjugate transposon protein [Bacteroides eggerthii]
MTGSTLKMQLAENCLTDDGQRIRKGTPVFGEVMKIDGERVLVRITSGKPGRQPYFLSKRKYILRMQWKGIYVPGNAKAETIQEAEAAGVSGAGTNIAGGLDVGQPACGGGSKQYHQCHQSAASKNIRKIKGDNQKLTTGYCSGSPKE